MALKNLLLLPLKASRKKWLFFSSKHVTGAQKPQTIETHIFLFTRIQLQENPDSDTLPRSYYIVTIYGKCRNAGNVLKYNAIHTFVSSEEPSPFAPKSMTLKTDEDGGFFGGEGTSLCPLEGGGGLGFDDFPAWLW